MEEIHSQSDDQPSFELLKPQQSIQSEIAIPQGLPNLGNTCYLNSALQQLYQMDLINKFIASYKAQKENFITILQQLFETMSCQGQYNKPRQILKKMTKYLPVILPDYVMGDQGDSFDAFLNILDYLFKIGQNLKERFSVGFTLQCSCKDVVMNIVDVSIENSEKMICCNCQKTIRRSFHTFPEYLIVKFSNNKKPAPILEVLDHQKFCYQIQSKNMYVGNGNSGHYFAECQYKGQFYVFNDSSRRKITDKSYGQCKFAIYNKILKYNLEPSKKSESSKPPESQELSSKQPSIPLLGQNDQKQTDKDPSNATEIQQNLIGQENYLTVQRMISRFVRLLRCQQFNRIHKSQIVVQNSLPQNQQKLQDNISQKDDIVAISEDHTESSPDINKNWIQDLYAYGRTNFQQIQSIIKIYKWINSHIPKLPANFISNLWKRQGKSIEVQNSAKKHNDNKSCQLISQRVYQYDSDIYLTI